ncbi:MAG: hypothetical protein HY909_03335 [Deltaproteobacteria bacterium]|nr:hypothetical protein [Deltaproteobacteria bacterium]
MRLLRLPPWREALFHVLSWLRVDDASCLWDADYERWAREALPAAALDPLDEDRALLGALYQRSLPGARLLHALDLLHGDSLGQREGLRHTLAELAGGALAGTCDRGLLAALSSLEPALVELTRVALARVLPAWERAMAALEPTLAQGFTALESALHEASRAVDLRGVTVWAALPLGLRGRSRGGEVLVGLPGAWGAACAPQVAQQALHERAVGLASEAVGEGLGPEARHLAVEATAVRALDLALRGTGLEAERGRWRARHDLTALERPGTSAEDAARAVVRRLRRRGYGER